MTASPHEDVGTLRQSLLALQRVADDGDADAPLTRSIQSLGTALEELEVTLEELQAQNAELQAVRDELLYEQQRFQDLFHHAPEPYVVTDVEGVISQANAAAGELLGVPDRQLPGRHLLLFVRGADRPDITAFVGDLGDDPETTELVLYPRHHAPVAVSAVVVPRRSAGGRPAELRWMLRDVSDARRAQAALQEAFARSEEEAQDLRDRDRWKDAFLSAAAHDLRSPIDAITLAARAVVAGAEPRRQRHLVEGIATQATRLGRLLDDLLDLDRFTRGTVTAERVPVDLADLLDEVLDNLPGDGHHLEVDVPRIVAAVDRQRTAQIVDNLVRNALRHTPPGTPVTIRVCEASDGVDLVVEDGGPGVPTPLRETVFRPFVTRRAHVDDELGTGLGLSLVRLFAELHGGSARVEEARGGGARFVVHLPARVGA